ncbi:hypothetical protein ACIBHX_01570 [Nonomuraea sp. NPDC050536]|uniref:hypothetical protein n=1 Tax=Nonomuraea sp. NPDC050536 TaxID=3364366 RepID=UPI0037C6BCBA
MTSVSAHWLSVGEAAARLRLPEQVVRELAITQAVRSRKALDHWELWSEAVDAHAHRIKAEPELAAHKGDVLADHSRLPVGQGPEIGNGAEREFRDSQGDYDDTPNDEGDDD